MNPLKNLLKFAVALGVLFAGSNAHAEIITYQFAADITFDSDSRNVIGANVGDTVTGTFSFDTAAPAYVTDGRRIDVAYRDTGDIETDLVVIDGGRDSVLLDGTTITDSERRDVDGLSVLDSERNTTVTNLSTGATTDARFAIESVTFYFGDADALSSTDLPESLDLDQFDGATYLVRVDLANGESAYAIGRITSLARVGSGGSAEVPELSASGAVSSLAVLLGSAYVIVSRRREDAAAS